MQQLLKAINFIEENLKEELSLESIADSAHFSIFHFARLFKGITGLSIMGYVQSRRLSEAAQQILKNDARLIDIAIEYKFSSHEAFSRSFKKAFGVSPNEYKKTTQPIRLHYLEKLNIQMIDHLSLGINLDPKIVDLDEINVIGICKKFDDENKNLIPELWDELILRLEEFSVKEFKDFYGVCQTKNIYESDFQYTAGIYATKDLLIPSKMEKISIPPSKYAVFEHKVRKDNIHEDLKASLKYIWGTWLPRSKYKYTGTPDFELYGKKFNFSEASGVIELYVPIA